MSSTTTAPPVLSPFDRCDRCGAAAKAQAILTNGGRLYFCGHHARKHAAQLEQQNARLHYA